MYKKREEECKECVRTDPTDEVLEGEQRADEFREREETGQGLGKEKERAPRGKMNDR